MESTQSARDRAYSEWRTAIRTAHGSQVGFHLPWRERFENFLADMGEPPPGARLRRRDSKNSFNPANCIWK